MKSPLLSKELLFHHTVIWHNEKQNYSTTIATYIKQIPNRSKPKRSTKAISVTGLLFNFTHSSPYCLQNPIIGIAPSSSLKWSKDYYNYFHCVTLLEFLSALGHMPILARLEGLLEYMCCIGYDLVSFLTFSPIRHLIWQVIMTLVGGGMDMAYICLFLMWKHKWERFYESLLF